MEPETIFSRRESGIVAHLYEKYPALRKVDEAVDTRICARKPAVRLLPKGGVGAEIGVFVGHFSPVLLSIAKPDKLYLVDGWGALWGGHFPDWRHYTAHGSLETAAALEAVRARTNHASDRVEIVESASLDWLGTIPCGHLDWVYLDSSHSYEDTLVELRAIAPKLKTHGVILLDDCNPYREGKDHGVYRAVRDFTRTADFEIARLDYARQCLVRRILD